MRLLQVIDEVPRQRVPVEEAAADLGLSSVQGRVYRRYHQLRSVALAPKRSLPELFDTLLTRLLVSNAEARAHIRYVVYAHTIQGNLPLEQTLFANLREKFGLERAAFLSLTMGHCASGILALDLASTLLASLEKGEQVLVLTGEKCFSADVAAIPSSLMAEGVAAALLQNGREGCAVSKVVSRYRGECSVRPHSLNRETLRRYYAVYNKTLAATIREAVQEAGLELSNVDRFLPHNANYQSLKEVAGLLGVPIDRFFTRSIFENGHSFCADVFLNFAEARRGGELPTGSTCVVFSAGLSGTFAAAVLKEC